MQTRCGPGSELDLAQIHSRRFTNLLGQSFSFLLARQNMPSSAHNGVFDPMDSSRVQSPRPETPEPYVKQGRRNDPVGVQLLDDEGAISDQVIMKCSIAST